MSRCFPYPPPGSSGKRLYDEALIESIKVCLEHFDSYVFYAALLC